MGREGSRQVAGDRLASGPFVGRDAELDTLRAAVAAARGGSGRLVLLGGEPGIGKTRLLAELAAGYSRLGAHVLWGRCWEGKGAPAFWPWIQIARAIVRGHGRSVLRSMLGPAASDVAELVPELADTLGVDSPPPALEADQARFRLFDSISQLLQKTASVTPLVLILDDLHWADAASLRLLEFLAGELSDGRVIAVAAYRDVELESEHPLARVVCELIRHPSTIRMTLSGLDESAVASLIEAGTGTVPPRTLVMAVREKTDGNPLFVTEIVRLLRESGGSRQCGTMPFSLTAPPTIREAVGRRVRRLSADDLSVLAVASVVGRDFDVAILDKVVDRPDRVLRALHEAAVEDIIHPLPESLGRYRFAHVLFRDVLYDDLPLADRVRWHRRVGEALEELSRGDPSPPLDSLADHFFHAAQGGDVEKAIVYAERAGRQAVRLLAYDEAVDHYRRALGALKLKRADGARTCTMLLALGDAERRAGLLGEARSTFEEAAACARRLGAADLLARAALGLGEPWVHDPGEVDELLIGLLAEALRLLPADDGELRVMAMARLAWALYTSAPERGVTLSRQALAAADPLRHPQARLFALAARYYFLWQSHDVREQLGVAQEITRTAHELGDKEVAVRGHLYEIPVLLCIGDLPAVDERIESAAWLAAELRQPRYLWQTGLLRAMRSLLRGHYAQAEQLRREAAAIGRHDHPVANKNFVGQVLALRLDCGGLEALIEPIRELAAQPGSPVVWRCALSAIYAALGHEAAARAEFEDLARNDFEQIAPGFLWVVSLSLLSDTCVFLRDAPRARILHELLTPRAALNVVVGIGAICLGPVAHALGQLATVACSWQEAERHFRAAFEMHRRLESPPLLARTRTAYARMLLARRAAGDRRQAEELLSSALIDAESLGARMLVADIQSLQRALGERRSAQVPATRTGRSAAAAGRERARTEATDRIEGRRTGNLFRREGQYWRITYQGNSVSLKSTKGLELIGQLLRNPGVEIHAIDLVALRAAVDPLRPAAKSPGREAPAALPLDCGPTLDVRAKAAYRERLDELRERLSEAERWNDVGNADTARREIELLTQHLAENVGLNGRPRAAGSIAERARVSVRNDISRALQTIRLHHQALWRHLCNAIKTGTFCSYQPDDRVAWTY